MQYIRDLAKKNNQRPEDLFRVIIGCVGLALIGFAVIITMTVNIHGLSKTPISATCKLRETSYKSPGAIAIHTAESSYVLRKESRYSARSFGFLDNMPLDAMRDMLDRNVGADMQFKYVQVSGENQIVQLSINGVHCLDEAIAVGDYIGLEKTTRWIGIAILSLAVIILVLAWKGIIH